MAAQLPLARQRRVGPVEQVGQVQQPFFRKLPRRLVVWVPPDGGKLRSPLISIVGHWLEPDRPLGPVVLSESILGRSFFFLPPTPYVGLAGETGEWAGDWDRDWD